MAIKVYLEEAIAKLVAERDRAVATVKEKVMREKIVPFNIEIDKARDSAIAQRQSEMNAEIRTRQEAFNAEKQAFIESAEKKKKENADAVISVETKIVCDLYDEHIERLNQQLSELTE